MIREIRFGSRESKLAVIQTKLIMDIVAKAHPELSLRLITMKTKGDLHPELSLEAAAGDGGAGKGLFTGALEQALAEGVVDICVHSLKDMVMEETALLPIVGMAKRGDPRDILLLPQRNDAGFSELTPSEQFPMEHSVRRNVGCSSTRRRIQLLARFPGISVAPIRGNVPTRLAKLDQGQYDALILAAAGIERLDIRDRPGYFFAIQDMIPAAGQGVLAIQGRHGEDYAFLDAVRDPLTEEAARTERHLMQALGGGCHFPAAAYAEISGAEIYLIAMYAADMNAPVFTEEIAGERDHAAELVKTLAHRLLSMRQG